MSSGDGRTEKTAFIVTRIADEYAVLNALELKFNGQALIANDGKFYDEINIVTDEEGIDKIYFDINLFFGK